MKLLVRAVPGAQRTEVMEWMDENQVKIRLNAAPEKGKANTELVAFVAKRLGIPKSHVTVLKGTTSRNKTLGLPDMDMAEIRNAL